MKRAAVLVLLLIFIACKAEQSNATTDVAQREAAAARSAAAPAAQKLVAPARMIVRNATVSLVVRDAATALQSITAHAEKNRGYVSESRQWSEKGQVRASVTLRVPSSDLTSTLGVLRKLALRTTSETVTSDDITEEYTDLGAQLANLQAVEKELRELLTTVRDRTQKASEIMEVYAEIARVRGEIERIQGRVKYLSQTAAMSAISVDLVPDAIAAPVVEPGWQPLVTIRAASRALVNALRSIADVTIWLVLYALPIGGIFIAAVLLIHAIWVRRPRFSGPPATSD